MTKYFTSSHIHFPHLYIPYIRFYFIAATAAYTCLPPKFIQHLFVWVDISRSIILQRRIFILPLFVIRNITPLATAAIYSIDV